MPRARTIAPAVMTVLAIGVSAFAQETRKAQYVCPPCPVDCHDEVYEAPGKCNGCGMTLIKKDALRNVAIVLWEGVEILDFAGPTEVFASTRIDGVAQFNVYTVASSREAIVSQGVVTVAPEYTLDDCPPPDIFVLPGGGTTAAVADERLIDWVREVSKDAEISMSVCTGAFVLARAGVLDGLEATTWHGAIDGLRMLALDTVVHENRRWVDNGNVITSAGVSAGIDASLYVVSRLHGTDVARATAEYMEYNWTPDRLESRVVKKGGPRALTATQRILRTLQDQGVDAALAQAKLLRAKDGADAMPAETDVNRLGYRYLQDGRHEDAVAVFRLNVSLYPDAFNTYDSLAEAYVKSGRIDDAIVSYRKSLDLNPANDNARQMLTKLQIR